MPDEYKGKISDDDAKTIKKAVEEAKEVLKDADADKDKLEAAGKELSDKIMPIGAKMYQQASDDKKASDDDAKSDETKDDDAVEGEVVDK
jgi:molecular chaperone DnaK